MSASPAGRLRIALAPEAPSWLMATLREVGARLARAPEAEALIWTSPDDPVGLAQLLAAAPQVRWVQLPWAGIEPYQRAGLVDQGRIWTSAKGVYGRPVAEHALALMLAGLRQLKGQVSLGRWGPQLGTSLFGAAVTIFGRGGIATELARLLAPFECTLTCVARDAAPVPWAQWVVPVGNRHEALAGADVVVLALALVPSTRCLISASELRSMREEAWLVNVARGEHVVTDDLLVALQEGRIAGAALDVTEPEPLPADHPLWSLPNCLITPHTAVTARMGHPLLARHVAENLARFASGRPLLGVVDPALGY